MRISGYISSSISAFVLALAAVSCSFSDVTAEGVLSAEADIYPDYRNVTVPCNIAPLNFNYVGESCDAAVLDIAGIGQVKASRDGLFKFSAKTWKRICSDGGAQLTVLVKNDGKWMAHPSFRVEVSNDPIDPYVAYRLIPPGYQGWKSMGIYQRDLTSYRQSAIFDNSLTNESCMNCHSFADRNPEKMVFHMRGQNGGTYLIDGEKIEKLNTKTPQTISALVYPQWHPGGRYIAFSVNDTFQVFHSTDRNRIEVYDTCSDVVLYDTERHEIMSSPLLMTEERFETYPSFSPDGKTLYFCSSPAREMPNEYKEVQYSICSIGFDPDSGRFGETVDTLYQHGSAVFPRLSPDGHFLMFTESGYGCFPIWHKDADIKMIDLRDGAIFEMAELNSADVDSYHSWSSSSRWVIFSSRREDGLYTRLYISHIDESGNCAKPFMLPQKDPDFSKGFFKSFNIPEFTAGKVIAQEKDIADRAVNDKGTDIRWKD